MYKVNNNLQNQQSHVSEISLELKWKKNIHHECSFRRRILHL